MRRRFQSFAKEYFPVVRSWLAYAALPAVGLITAPVLARALGPEGRGQLAGMLQPMVLASAVAALGVPSAVTYFIASGGSAPKVRSAAAKISVVMTIIVAAALLAYSGKVAAQLGVDRVWMLVVWGAFVPSAFISVRRAHLQGLRRYGLLDLERVLSSVLRVLLIVTLWVFHVQNVLIYAAVYMIAGLAASSVLKRPNINEGIDGSNPEGWEFTKYAIFSSFGTIAAAMSARLDQAIMPAVVRPVELGYFSVAVAVAEVATIITQVISRNVLAESSSGAAPRIIAKTIAFGALGQVVLIATIAAIIPFAVPMVFGASFAPASDIIRILLLGAFVAYWSQALSALLSGQGRPGYASIGPALGAAATAILFAAFWHRMDSGKAAWVSVASQAVTLVANALLLLGIIRARTRLAKAHAESGPLD